MRAELAKTKERAQHVEQERAAVVAETARLRGEADVLRAERDQLREREAEHAAEQRELDSIALMRMRGSAPA